MLPISISKEPAGITINKKISKLNINKEVFFLINEKNNKMNMSGVKV